MERKGRRRMRGGRGKGRGRREGEGTSNLRKAHVTRDSSCPATLEISVGIQQQDINAS